MSSPAAAVDHPLDHAHCNVSQSFLWTPCTTRAARWNTLASKPTAGSSGSASCKLCTPAGTSSPVADSCASRCRDQDGALAFCRARGSELYSYQDADDLAAFSKLVMRQTPAVRQASLVCSGYGDVSHASCAQPLRCRATSWLWHTLVSGSGMSLLSLGHVK